MIRKLCGIFFILCILPLNAFAEDILNVYAWVNEVPGFIIRQFEEETGVKVNFSTYENNEIMYAKLRAVKNAGYDIVMPSSYFLDRMRRQDMLEKLDKTKLPNLKNLDPTFIDTAYDPKIHYCVPFLWGITGIFVNSRYFPVASITKWADLWNAQYKNQLLMLDDTREMFSMALLSLGFSANDRNPEHIKMAFLKLKALMKNIKVFSTDGVVSIIIDEDATLGMAWNGDIYKAQLENTNIKFIYPQEGFVIWVDNFAIPKNAPHKERAYDFINFMLRPDIAKEIALYTRFPTTNAAGQKLLPKAIQTNPTMYPPKAVMSRAQFQTDVGDDTLALYEKYWEELKMGE